MRSLFNIAVVIPCFRVKRHILGVIDKIGQEVNIIIVVDDCCPEGSGAFVQEFCQDKRLIVHRLTSNQGVGGAVMAGYQIAIDHGADIIVKVDGDGQMDPVLIGDFVNPIALGEADYTKGNRFFDLKNINQMPPIRIFGNAVLSLMNKISSGYWDIFDPTNGYTAIRADIAGHLPFDKISKRYFFESDMLFRLNTLRAVVVDVPMDARYGDEESNLKISKIMKDFLLKNLANFLKRLFYNYYLRDMSIASIELPLGVVLLLAGSVFGMIHWHDSLVHGRASPAGTVILAALTILVGLQLVLSFISYDIASVPKIPRYKRLRSAIKTSADSGQV